MLKLNGSINWGSTQEQESFFEVEKKDRNGRKMVFNQSRNGLYFSDETIKRKRHNTHDNPRKTARNEKIAIDYAKLTEHIRHVFAHPITTEKIIKITERGSIHSFPVNKANVQVDKDIFRNDIETTKYKKARDEQFLKLRYKQTVRDHMAQ